LPYELHVNGEADVNRNTFEISIANTGDQGAHFYVYSSNRTDGPWRYTVEAGKSLSETFDLTTTNGVYVFEVFGPNGFVRKFAGNAQPSKTQNSHGLGQFGNKPALPEVKTQYDVANGNVFLKFSNSGGGIARLTVTDNAYGARTRPVLVPAGSHLEEVWVLAASHHWYDLTVTSNDDASFSRRFAGHVENGRPSISDPAAVAPVLV
jgi:phospholipase C